MDRRQKIRRLLADGEWKYRHEIFKLTHEVDSHQMYHALEDLVDEGILEKDNSELIKYRQKPT